MLISSRSRSICTKVGQYTTVFAIRKRVYSTLKTTLVQTDRHKHMFLTKYVLDFLHTIVEIFQYLSTDQFLIQTVAVVTTVLRHVLLGCDAVHFSIQVRKNMLLLFLYFQGRITTGTIRALSPCSSVQNVTTFVQSKVLVS